MEPAHAGQYFEPHPAAPVPAPHRAADAARSHAWTWRRTAACSPPTPWTRAPGTCSGPAPPLPAGAANLVDLGCGYGPIALTLARRAPSARVWALDVNTRAVDLTRANAATAQVDNVTALVVPADPAEPVDGMPEDLIIDALWSNPPIRVGKPVLHALLSYWLGRLGQHGEACLVVHKHLGADSLTTWLNRSGWPTTRFGSRVATGSSTSPGAPA